MKGIGFAPPPPPQGHPRQNTPNGETAANNRNLKGFWQTRRVCTRICKDSAAVDVAVDVAVVVVAVAGG